MIQRIQTVYLLLAAAAGVATWFFNLWRAKLVNNTYQYFSGQSNYLYFVAIMIIVALAVVCIFLFKKRPLQLRLTILNLILALGVIALQYWRIQVLQQHLEAVNMLADSTYLPAAFLPVLIVILLFLAARGIYKDERLVRSLDRLR